MTTTSAYRGDWRTFIVAVVMAMMVVACLSAKQPPGSPEQGNLNSVTTSGIRKGASQMAALQLTIQPKHTEVLVGESLNIEVTLENKSPAPVEVHSPDAPSEFEFILRPTADASQARVLSARRIRLARNIEPGPRLPTEKISLGPGEKTVYQDDLTRYAVPVVGAGEYLLSVAYNFSSTRIESAGVKLRIVPPHIGALAITVGPSEGRLATVFTHTDAGNNMAVFQRESKPGRPNDGIAFRRVDLAPPSLITGVASAIELGRNRGDARWFGWLQNDALGAGVAQNKTLFVRVNPVPLGLRSSRLQSVGWQPTQESALFAVMGLDAQGRVALAVATFQATGSGRTKAVQLTAPAMPTHWAAQYHPQNGAARFDVIWAEVANGKSRIVRQTVTPETGRADSPVILVERGGPLAALALAPIASNGSGMVDVLYGPAGDDAKLSFLRLALNGGPPMAEWTFTAPADKNKQRPTVWAIAPTPLPDPVVLAKLGDKLMVRRVSGGSDWSLLTDGAAQVDHLRLELIQGTVWVIWADPANGTQYKLVPLS